MAFFIKRVSSGQLKKFFLDETDSQEEFDWSSRKLDPLAFLLDDIPRESEEFYKEAPLGSEY